MVNISIDVTDLGGEARPGDKVVLWKPAAAGSATHAGRVISTAPVDVLLTDGKATVPDVEPGEMRALLQCRGFESQEPIPVTVPDDTGTVTLRALIESQFEYSPPIVSAVQQAADRAEAGADRVGTAEQVGVWASEASASAGSAASAESNAKQSELAASGYADNADGHANRAESAADTAATSETNAAQSEADAGGFAEMAEQYKNAAEQHKNDAEQSKADAAQSASSADGDAGAAATSASSAAQSESNAATHAQDSLTYAAQSEAARDESRLARDEAVTAAENAQQGAPSDGWKKAELSQQVQDSLSRADTALQSIPVATASAPGSIRLSGDLGGTAQAPTVPGLAGKADAVHTHTTTQVDGLDDALDGKADAVHTHTTTQVDGLDDALARLSNIRAWFRGDGPPPASIPGAQVGDWWLDETAMELHEITGV